MGATDDLESNSENVTENTQDEDSRLSTVDSQDSNSMLEGPNDSKEASASDDNKANTKKRPTKSSWRDRHLKRELEKQEKQEEDYVFKTKRQIVLEQEHAPAADADEQDEDEERIQKRKEAKEREKKQKQIE